MECSICKIQYVGKSEWRLKRRINQHRNDVWRIDGPPCDKHFQKQDHDFTKHAKFTVIENPEKVTNDKEKTRSILEVPESFGKRNLNLALCLVYLIDKLRPLAEEKSAKNFFCFFFSLSGKS